MKIKNILTACLVCCGFATAFTSCSKDEDGYFTVSEDDAPRILNTDFPTGGFSINRNENLKFEILVTPADYTTVKWITDSKEVVGKTIDEPFEAGDYTLKIVAVTTRGKETSRTMSLTVKALDTDPQPGNDLADRLVKSGTSVKLHGANMSKVKQVKINGQFINVTNATSDCVDYTIPADLAGGTYRISVIDEHEISYGAGLLSIATKATIANAAFAGLSKGSLTMEGYYLDQVATITINGQECAITEKSENKLTITAPELEVGDYELKGTTTAGEPISFFKDNQLTETALFMVAEEEVLWMGDFVVDWDGPEDHKEWRMISQEKFATFEIGHTLTISLKLVGSDYHKYQFDNWSWVSLPGQSPTDFGEDTDVAVEITEALKKAVAEQAFCIHGHGFSVTKATYK